jgi:hypothetical protein
MPNEFPYENEVTTTALPTNDVIFETFTSNMTNVTNMSNTTHFTRVFVVPEPQDTIVPVDFIVDEDFFMPILEEDDRTNETNRTNVSNLTSNVTYAAFDYFGCFRGAFTWAGLSWAGELWMNLTEALLAKTLEDNATGALWIEPPRYGPAVFTRERTPAYELGSLHGATVGTYSVCWSYEAASVVDHRVPVGDVEMVGPSERQLDRECALGSRNCSVTLPGYELQENNSMAAGGDYLSASANIFSLSSCDGAGIFGSAAAKLPLPNFTNGTIHPNDTMILEWRAETFGLADVLPTKAGPFALCWRAANITDFSWIPVGTLHVPGPLQFPSRMCTLGHSCVLTVNGYRLYLWSRVALAYLGPGHETRESCENTSVVLQPDPVSTTDAVFLNVSRITLNISAFDDPMSPYPTAAPTPAPTAAPCVNHQGCGKGNRKRAKCHRPYMKRDCPRMCGECVFNPPTPEPTPFPEGIDHHLSPGDFNLCWAADGPEYYDFVGAGSLRLVGPFHTEFECTLGIPCNATLIGVDLNVSNRAVLSEVCGEGFSTTGLTVGLSQMLDPERARFNFGVATKEPGDYKLCWASAASLVRSRSYFKLF